MSDKLPTETPELLAELDRLLQDAPQTTTRGRLEREFSLIACTSGLPTSEVSRGLTCDDPDSSFNLARPDVVDRRHGNI